MAAMTKTIPAEEFKRALKSVNELLKQDGKKTIKIIGCKKKQIVEDFIKVMFDFRDSRRESELPESVIDFWNTHFAISEEEPEESLKQPETRPVCKIAAYRKRLKDPKHLQTIKFSFGGTAKDVLKIVKAFGELTVEYVDDAEVARFFPPLNISLREIGADFKYCYEKFEKWVRRIYGNREWTKVFEMLREKRIYELYECVNQDANLSCLYNLPTSLIFDKGKLTGNELKVLLAFMVRAKMNPKMGGIKICGWGPTGLGREIGIDSRDTVRKCIKKLEEVKYIKLLPALSNNRCHTYQVFL